MSERPKILGGYLVIARRMFRTDPLWLESRMFSRAEAWIDILQLAPWRRTSIQVRGAFLELDRGEFLGGRGFLAGRWGWSEKRVRSFLELLADDQRIRISRATPRGTIYAIVNYDAFQGARAGSRAGSGSAVGPGGGPAQRVGEPGDRSPRGRVEGQGKAGSRATRGPKEKANNNPSTHETSRRATATNAEILEGLREGIGRLIDRGVGDLEEPLRRRAREASSDVELIALGDEIEAILDRLENPPELKLVEPKTEETSNGS